MESWESGSDHPTFNQLCKLADVVKRPLAVFFLPRPPKDESKLPDFRRFDPAWAADSKYSAELLLAIRKARFKRHAALELAEELDEPPPLFTAKATLEDDPEDVASRLRDELLIDDELNSLDARIQFNRRRMALEEAGVLVFQAEKIELDEMRGFSITERPLPCVVVNIKDAPQARSFSLFHETAHILLGNGGLCNFEEEGGSNTLKKTETFCNHVAGATLVPADSLLSLPETPKRLVSEVPDDRIARIGRHFGVSNEVILRRLVILKRIPLAFYLSRVFPLTFSAKCGEDFAQAASAW